MAYDTFMALVVFAITTSLTPGPNNMMLFASGVNFGFRKTIPHMLGISLGFLLLLLVVGFGLGAVLKSIPMLFVIIKFAGGVYLLWIAYKIGTSRALADTAEAKIRAKPLTFIQAAAFQWVNPKAWVMAITAMATYADKNNYLVTLVIVATVFAAINLPTVSSWTAFGSVLKQWLADPIRLKWFNLTMAVLLVLSLWPMLK